MNIKKITNSIDNMKIAIRKKNKNYMVQKKELKLIKQNLLKIKINNL